MKAIRVHEFGDPEVMQVEEVTDPRPGPGQVVVKIRAIGINPVDTYIRSGIYHIKPQLPYTPGNDAAGIRQDCCIFQISRGAGTGRFQGFITKFYQTLWIHFPISHLC